MPRRLIPLEVLTADPDRTSPQISPGGDLLTYLATGGGARNVFLARLPEIEGTQLTRESGHGVIDHRWAWDGRHVLYRRDREGDENYHLCAVDVETGSCRDLTPFEGVRVELVGLSPLAPDAVVVQMNREDPGRLDAYRVSISTGECAKVADGEGGVARWIADPQLQVRGRIRVLPDGGVEIGIRDGEDAPWRALWSADDDEDDTIMVAAAAPVSLSADGRSLFLCSGKGTHTMRLLEIDLASGAVEVLFADEGYDVMWTDFDPATGRPLLGYGGRQRRDAVAVDARCESDLQALREIDSGDLGLVSHDAEGRHWVVSFASPHLGTSYVLWDRETRRAARLFAEHPDWSEYRLAQVDPFSYRASDGLEIEGYLTFPPAAERRRLPAIVHVHGGPHGRDGWVFLPSTQMLANRGYLVIQVNYRGSSGLGRSLLEAGRREWARRMHQDVVEAAGWAVAQGYADPDRLGIMGGSYGGYEALVAVTFTPDVFRCAVSMYGPVNLITLLETIPPYWIAQRRYFADHIGTLEHDRDLLWERSPLRLVDRIKVPLLLIYGENDPRVKISEGRQIVQALERKGIAHEFVSFPDEGHGWTKPQNRLRALSLAERFFAEHLGGGAES